MKILLLGANGQLGRTFVEQGGLAVRGELVVASRDGTLTQGGGHGEIADLSTPESLPILLDRVKPAVIVNTAAYTGVDRAEQEEALATRVNAEAVGVLGQWAAARGALVIHYSTDYVFNGLQAKPYAVDAPTGPLGAYGRSKLAGELALRGSGAGHLIFRTAWVYAAHGHNFLRTILRLGAERDELRVVDDQHGAPTHTMLIVEATLAALDQWTPADATQRHILDGTYHLVASGATTWHGFASAIFKEAVELGLLAHPPHVVAVSSSEFQSQAVRPTSSLLDNTSFRQHFNFRLPDWQLGLHDVMRRLATT
ncbi:dTDP-4-dehydrorhamnose reductase [Rhodanobacter sp. AS-Z3]|uniref:dTDP-4-dehydrorhamnose reductase n=1 Tax=Rhodanobacter sp. AS-Z3 TaxID=3031330 RepID=UPI002478DB00|nr:dTDP-4-dehydrorhamnose reductase [Rhodanobacter sp. AS-Z3]WEN14957.1 dTDP-4-dehydrorhamnose reductase [Rhodanobacter sp. AS-Z3]